MNRLVIDIPYVTPKLDIECSDDKALRYLYAVLSPYVSTQVKEYHNSKKIIFREDEEGNTYFEIDGEKRKADVKVLRFVERYLLINSVVECNYVMLHGGGVVYNDCAFLFLGSSGAGKSTLIAYLCMEGYEYISDDRLIINLKQQTVIPYAKPIVLRPEGKEILYKNKQIETVSVRFDNVRKELYTPINCRKSNTKISRIYILARKEKGCVRQEQITNQMKIHELLKHSLSVKDCRNWNKFMQLSKIPVEILHYSEMADINKMLKQMC